MKRVYLPGIVQILMETTCTKCHGTGIVEEIESQSVHTCWACLTSGKMDTQRKEI